MHPFGHNVLLVDSVDKYGRLTGVGSARAGPGHSRLNDHL